MIKASAPGLREFQSANSYSSTCSSPDRGVDSAGTEGGGLSPDTRRLPSTSRRMPRGRWKAGQQQFYKLILFRGHWQGYCSGHILVTQRTNAPESTVRMRASSVRLTRCAPCEFQESEDYGDLRTSPG